jgi:hypothetical protein
VLRFTSRALLGLGMGNPSLRVPLKFRRMETHKIWVLQAYDDLGYLYFGILC